MVQIEHVAIGLVLLALVIVGIYFIVMSLDAECATDADCIGHVGPRGPNTKGHYTCGTDGLNAKPEMSGKCIFRDYCQSTEDAECGEDRRCEPMEGSSTLYRCMHSQCDTNIDCAPLRDPKRKTCVDHECRGCETSADCTGGYGVCDTVKKSCVVCDPNDPAEMDVATSSCPANESCSPEGQCGSSCTTRDDCKLWELCDGSQCRWIDSCSADEDCTGSNKCVDGECGDCAGDADCTGGKTCDFSGIGGRCTSAMVAVSEYADFHGLMDGQGQDNVHYLTRPSELRSVDATPIAKADGSMETKDQANIRECGEICSDHSQPWNTGCQLYAYDRAHPERGCDFYRIDPIGDPVELKLTPGGLPLPREMGQYCSNNITCTTPDCPIVVEFDASGNVTPEFHTILKNDWESSLSAVPGTYTYDESFTGRVVATQQGPYGDETVYHIVNTRTMGSSGTKTVESEFRLVKSGCQYIHAGIIYEV